MASTIAHKISTAQARRITEALGNPSYELSPETPTVTWRALIAHGLAYHGELRERVRDERGHLVRSHGVMLTDDGVTEARRIAGDDTVTREDVARGAEDALKWLPYSARDNAAAAGAVSVLEKEFRRTRTVMRRAMKHAGPQAANDALKQYNRAEALMKAARRFEQEDAATAAQEEDTMTDPTTPAADAPGQQYGGITREDVANGNGPAEALWRAGEYFRMHDAQHAAPAAEEAPVERTGTWEDFQGYKVRTEERGEYIVAVYVKGSANDIKGIERASLAYARKRLTFAPGCSAGAVGGGGEGRDAGATWISQDTHVVKPLPPRED
ncbi:hypothetical protein AB0E08_07450 [Streptomyces sp. NPDC048281]|uniref:hypothetical protein n=1 Tax=Streptomyces sp. NPDC048281 TaxID=3154715 RepID=UPI00342BF3F0